MISFNDQGIVVISDRALRVLCLGSELSLPNLISITSVMQPHEPTSKKVLGPESDRHHITFSCMDLLWVLEGAGMFIGSPIPSSRREVI